MNKQLIGARFAPKPLSRLAVKAARLVALSLAGSLLAGCSGSNIFAPNSPVTVLPHPRTATPTTPRAQLPSPLSNANQTGIEFQPQFLPQTTQVLPSRVQPVPIQQIQQPQANIYTGVGMPSVQTPNNVPTINAGAIGLQQQGQFLGTGITGAPRGNQVAMLLPLSGSGGLATAAKQMRTAALVAKSSTSGMNLSFYDTAGTASGARVAARKALNEGAGIILGPLLGSSIDSVASVANPSGVSVVAFSNDVNRARPGAYVLGVGPGGSIDRVLQYAARQGKRQLAIVTPQNALGDAARAAAQSAASRYGINIVRQDSYPAGSGSTGKSELAEALSNDPNFDSLLITDIGSSSRAFAALLQFNQFNFERKQILGTDRWADGSVTGEVGLRNAWYAAPTTGSSSTLTSRLGSTASSVALVAHDAVAMAGDLLRTGGFQSGNLTKPSGFLGATGLFRLSSSGRVERQYEVRQITGASSRVLDGASGFGGLNF